MCAQSKKKRNFILYFPPAGNSQPLPGKQEAIVWDSKHYKSECNTFLLLFSSLISKLMSNGMECLFGSAGLVVSPARTLPPPSQITAGGKMETTECEQQGKTTKEEYPVKHQCLLIWLRLLLILNIEVVLFFRNKSIIIVFIYNYYNVLL